MKYKYTPDNVEDLFPLSSNEVLVFSSNNQGRHGKGLALLARNHCGARYGQARGLQGNSYAIVTKDLRIGIRSIPFNLIQLEIETLYEFATNCSDLIFYVPKIGCSLAGYSIDEIAPLFKNLENKRPSNVIIPKEFKS